MFWITISGGSGVRSCNATRFRGNWKDQGDVACYLAIENFAGFFT